MTMIEFFKSVLEWQRNKFSQPIPKAKAVCLICLGEVEVGKPHYNCQITFAQALPICLVCNTKVYPGEQHTACNRVIARNLSSKWQCIICARDEREGDHTDCQSKINSIRQELGIRS